MSLLHHTTVGVPDRILLHYALSLEL